MPYNVQQLLLSVTFRLLLAYAVYSLLLLLLLLLYCCQ